MVYEEKQIRVVLTHIRQAINGYQHHKESWTVSVQEKAQAVKKNLQQKLPWFFGHNLKTIENRKGEIRDLIDTIDEFCFAVLESQHINNDSNIKSIKSIYKKTIETLIKYQNAIPGQWKSSQLPTLLHNIGIQLEMLREHNHRSDIIYYNVFIAQKSKHRIGEGGINEHVCLTEKETNYTCEVDHDTYDKTLKPWLKSHINSDVKCVMTLTLDQLNLLKQYISTELIQQYSEKNDACTI